jgi:cell shape-determining protein MreC
MNKILFNKKTIVSLVTIIVIASSLIVYAKNNDLSYFLGQQVKSIQNNKKGI